MLAADGIDAVEVLVPHHLHEDISLKVIDSGRHLSLQKPMAMDVEQAASGETVVQSTPIICRGVATTRTVTRCQRPWAGTAKNNITRSIRWTPMFGTLAQKQVIDTSMEGLKKIK